MLAQTWREVEDFAHGSPVAERVGRDPLDPGPHAGEHALADAQLRRRVGAAVHALERVDRRARRGVQLAVLYDGVRALFFAGFAQLGAALGPADVDMDAVEELVVLAQRYRGFIVAHPALAVVMFSRPFASFDPAPEERAAGAAVRERIVDAVRRAAAAGRLHGDPTDIAHACVALVHGLAAAEAARRLGSTPAAVERRWEAAVRALLRGFGGTPG